MTNKIKGGLLVLLFMALASFTYLLNNNNNNNHNNIVYQVGKESPNGLIMNRYYETLDKVDVDRATYVIEWTDQEQPDPLNLKEKPLKVGKGQAYQLYQEQGIKSRYVNLD